MRSPSNSKEAEAAATRLSQRGSVKAAVVDTSAISESIKTIKPQNKPSRVRICAPATSANVGPGFDTLGLALPLLLTLDVFLLASDDNCDLTEKSRSTARLCGSAKAADAQEGTALLNVALEYVTAPVTDTKTNLNAGSENKKAVDETVIPQANDTELPAIDLSIEPELLDPRQNLIIQSAIYVLHCYGRERFPCKTFIRISNEIPLGRGLGSSAAAIAAGIALADVVADLKLSASRRVNFALMLERHPDNIVPAFLGGFVGSALSPVFDEAIHTSGALASAEELLDCSTKHLYDRQWNERRATSSFRSLPFDSMFLTSHYKVNPAIKFIVIIPEFRVNTSDARAVLPMQYSKQDLIFNIQRVALLTASIGADVLDPDHIYEAMQDRVHQPFRRSLIPALPEIIDTLRPSAYPGLLGICLSGAGPTILALAMDNFEEIAEAVTTIFAKSSTRCKHFVLDLHTPGLTTEIIDE